MSAYAPLLYVRLNHDAPAFDIYSLLIVPSLVQRKSVVRTIIGEGSISGAEHRVIALVDLVVDVNASQRGVLGLAVRHVADSRIFDPELEPAPVSGEMSGRGVYQCRGVLDVAKSDIDIGCRDLGHALLEWACIGVEPAGGSEGGENVEHHGG